MSALPSSWALSALETLCEIVRGITFPSSAKQQEKTDRNVCCLRTTNIQREIRWDDVYFVPREYVKRDAQLVQIGDVLMSMANSYELVGKVAVAREVPYQTAFGAFLSAVRPSDGILGQYLFHFLRSDRVQCEIRRGSSQTTNIANISIGTMCQIQMPIAPLKEQKRIADKLDTILARVDACREHLDRVPAIMKRFRQSVLAAATSGKLTEDWRLETGSLSKWRQITVGELLTDLRYGTSKKCSYEPSRTPVLRIPNVINGSVTHEDMKYAEFDEREIRSLSLAAGDILMIRSNGSIGLVGRTALVTDRERGFLYAGYLIRLRVDLHLVRPAYVSIFLTSPERRDIIENVARSTSGVNNINAEEIRSLAISVPDINEQTEIVRRVEALFAYADRLEARYAAARTQVEHLTPALLAKAFRGELIPQDPNDEPASVLLERIRSTSTGVHGKRNSGISITHKQRPVHPARKDRMRIDRGGAK